MRTRAENTDRPTGSDLQDCEMINLHCFKRLNMYYFVIAAIDNKYTILPPNKQIRNF